MTIILSLFQTNDFQSGRKRKASNEDHPPAKKQYSNFVKVSIILS